MFTFTDAASGPEPPTNRPVGDHFPTIDQFGLPWFPAATTPQTCVISATSGVALILDNTPLPCSNDAPDLDDNNNNADRGVVEGYVIVPDGAISISLQANNQILGSSSGDSGALHLYTAPSENANDLTFQETNSGTWGPVFTVEGSHNIQTFCTRSPALRFRAYVYDELGHMAIQMQWKVTGGAEDTSGIHQNIPLSHLSSVAGYDNDLDDNSIPDYQEIDTDADTISDWLEMGQTLGGNTIDTDGDGTPNCADADSDNDGSTDGADNNPLVPVAVPDSLSATRPNPIDANLGSNDTEFASGNNSFVDLGTGTASGHSLATNGQLQWNTDNVPVGTYTVDYQICNEAVGPPVCANTTATATIDEQADLATAVSYSPTLPLPGQTTTVSVSLVNNGPTDTTGANLVVNSPDNTTFVAATLPAACTLQDPRTLTCTNPGVAGQTTTYHLDLLVDPSAPLGSMISGGLATATADIDDPDTTNNAAPVALTSHAGISDITAPVLAGFTGALPPLFDFVLDIDFTNNGPTTAVSPELTVDLPTNVAFNEATQTTNECTAPDTNAPNTIVCDPDTTYSAGATHQVQLRLTTRLSVACLFALDPDATLDISVTVEQLSTDPTNPGSALKSFHIAASDADFDGVPDHTEIGGDCQDPIDTDGDSTPDYLDTDSDNDNIPDSDETVNGIDVDSDDDAKPDRLDPIGATIAGRVFLDVNLDGVQQPMEADISNVTVHLISAGPDAILGTSDDVVVAETITKSPYSFTNIADGNYRVGIDAGTLPYAVYATNDLAANVSVGGNTATFAMEPSFGQFYASISGTVTDANNSPVANAVRRSSPRQSPDAAKFTRSRSTVLKPPYLRFRLRLRLRGNFRLPEQPERRSFSLSDCSPSQSGSVCADNTDFAQSDPDGRHFRINHRRNIDRSVRDRYMLENASLSSK